MTTQSPFVGLRPFETDDADWFFGRDRETAVLAAKLRSASFTAVVGPSGSGKSSLVRAGVVPLLRGQGFKEIIAKPGTAPIERLARALALADPEPDFAQARYFRYDTALRASAFGLLRIVESLAADSPRMLLVIDQFEELFRYGDEASGAMKAGMREESRAFIELLLTGASGSNGRLHVCITMRSDFFGACSSYAGLAEAISVSQYLVPMPVRGQLELAIRKPVKKANARIEEALVQRLLVDVEEEQDRLPLLQHTLRRLWEYASGQPRTMHEDDYVGIGKIVGSIDLKAEQVRQALGEANAADLGTLERVMKSLTDLDVRGRATRRMQRRSELLALLEPGPFSDPKAAEASLDRMLKSLASEENSFLQLGQGKDPEVDIGHEALIPELDPASGPNRDFQSGWLREESDDGERWRGYVSRAREGTPMSLREAENVSRWLHRRKLAEPWSPRYGNRWKEVKAFIDRSWRRGAALATTAVLSVALVGTGWWQQERIGDRLHQSFDVEPFKKSHIRPYVLDTAAEQALQPLMSFADCADFSICPEMVVIPPGEFTMGSDNACYPGEAPPHNVKIARRFAVSKYELTFDQWETCVRHGPCHEVSDNRFGRGDRPVINLSWKDAKQYVDWLWYMTGKKYRLLSEAEWEYSARAGTKTPYYWDGSDGTKLTTTNRDACMRPRIEQGHANCALCGNGEDVDNQTTLPVGHFPPNQFGLCDTRGNVWEFTADKVHYKYSGLPPNDARIDAPIDGSPWLDNPDTAGRVVRGGSFSSNISNLRASNRFFVKSDEETNSGFGLRVGRTLVEAAPADKPVAGTPGRQNTCQIVRQLK